MKVNRHEDFCHFTYESKTSSFVQLGDIVKKDDEDGIDIGVIIQIQDEYEFRTDMFGNCHITEIVMASREDILKHRPDLFANIY